MRKHRHNPVPCCCRASDEDEAGDADADPVLPHEGMAMPSSSTFSSSSLRVAYYCTGHGLGHATRVIEVCRALLARRHAVIVVTGASPTFFTHDKVIRPFTKAKTGKANGQTNSGTGGGGEVLDGDAMFAVRSVSLDCGSVQQDALTVETEASLRTYWTAIHRNRDALLEEECRWLRRNHIDIVCSDIVPLAIAAAKRCDIPACCITNFAFDHIYAEYLDLMELKHSAPPVPAKEDVAMLDAYREMVDQISLDYSLSDMLLRLPGHSPMPGFDIHGRPFGQISAMTSTAAPAVVDLPFVVRRSALTQAEARRNLVDTVLAGRTRDRNVLLRAGLIPPEDQTNANTNANANAHANPHKHLPSASSASSSSSACASPARLLLLMFGGQSIGAKGSRSSLGFRPAADALPPNWTCVVSHGAWPFENDKDDDEEEDDKLCTHGRFVRLPRDAYIPDVIKAADCVLGKIGYGSTSEVIVHRVPLIFITRAHFNEEPSLRNLLFKHENAIEMPKDDFVKPWADYLDRAVRLQPNFRGPSDGAEKAAAIIPEIAHKRDARGKQKQNANRSILNFNINLNPKQNPT